MRQEDEDLQTVDREEVLALSRGVRRSLSSSSNNGGGEGSGVAVLGRTAGGQAGSPRGGGPADETRFGHVQARTWADQVGCVLRALLGTIGNQFDDFRGCYIMDRQQQRLACRDWVQSKALLVGNSSFLDAP